MAEPITSARNQTMKCPEGQVLFQGACVPVAEYRRLIATGGLSNAQGGNSGSLSGLIDTQGAQQGGVNTPKSNLADLSGLYGKYGQAIEQSTQASIEAARQTTQMQQQSLDKQLEQQRADYLRNRQTLQKETFLRGRNVLANLANRGLATTGLLQLGDVQRTIVTGQQMSNLADVFNRASESIQQSKLNLGTSLQQYTSQQQADMATKLAGLDMQQRDAQIKEAERLTALVEDTISASAGGTMTPEQQSLINQIYSATASGDTGTLQELLNRVETETGTGQGGLSSLVAPPQNTGDYIALAQKVSSYKDAGLTDKETSLISSYLKGSKYFKEGSDKAAKLLDALQTNRGKEATYTQHKKSGNAGYNDTYDVVFSDGKTAEVGGRDLMALVISGDIKLTKEQAVQITRAGDGQIIPSNVISGDKWDAFVKPYIQWLKDQGYIEQASRWTGDKTFWVMTSD